LAATATKQNISEIYRPSEFSLETVDFDDPGNRWIDVGTLDLKSALGWVY